MFLVFLIFSFNLEINLMTYAVTRKSFFLLLKRSRPMHSLKLVFSSDSDTRFVLTGTAFFFNSHLFSLSTLSSIKLVSGLAGHCCSGSERKMGPFHHSSLTARSEADSLYTFRTAYPVVVQSLETLSDDGDGKARGYLCSIKQFDFIIALSATEHVLSNTVSLSKMLQGKNVDLIEAAKEASVVINVMKVERDDPSVWKELYERGKQLAADVDIEPRIPRTAGRQQHRVNIPAETPEMYWQRAVYFPLVDHLVQELTDRLLSQEDRFLGQYLVPAKLNAFNSGVQGKLYETYKTDLSEKKDFDNEILRWQTKWSHSTEEKPVALTETLQHANPDPYPNVVTIITILLTMPVSTATPERSFSTMRRVKTYLRSTMKRERLSALALMHAYRDMPIDVEALIHEFCPKKNRRLAFEFL